MLPILNLNGYKIANPTILARISHEELEALFVGYGYKPWFVEGSEPDRDASEDGRDSRRGRRRDPRDLGASPQDGHGRAPALADDRAALAEGLDGPKEIAGHKVEGSWRSHQVPFSDVRGNPANLKLLETWMRSYKPEKLFDANGGLRPELKALAPVGRRRMGANPHANGGVLRKELKLPDFRKYAVEVAQAGKVLHENTKPLGEFLRDVMRSNMTTFRVFGPDETASNRLQSIYEVSKKTWMAELLPEDADGGELARDGRVMEMLSEHTLVGWLEGYLLSGRHGFFHTYEAFAHVIDSMFNQHAKWLDICKNHVPWRASVVVAEHPAVVDRLAAGPQRLLASGSGLHRPRDQQEPDRHARLLSARREHAARRRGPVPALDGLHQRDRRRQAEAPAVHDDRRGDRALRQGHRHLAPGEQRRGRGARRRDGLLRGRRDAGGARGDGDPARAPAGPQGALRERRRSLQDAAGDRAPARLDRREFDSLFTVDKPIIFNYHGYPWLIHKLAYRFRNHENLHVRGYKEKGNINTPLELAILNQAIASIS